MRFNPEISFDNDFFISDKGEKESGKTGFNGHRRNPGYKNWKLGRNHENQKMGIKTGLRCVVFTEKPKLCYT